MVAFRRASCNVSSSGAERDGSGARRVTAGSVGHAQLSHIIQAPTLGAPRGQHHTGVAVPSSDADASAPDRDS